MNTSTTTSKPADSFASYRGRIVRIPILAAVLTGFLLLFFELGDPAVPVIPGASPTSIWAAEHQNLVAVAIVGAVAVGQWLLWRMARQPMPATVPGSTIPPERVSPAVAFAVASRQEPSQALLLPVLLDLVDRGFYAAEVQQPVTPGEPVDLVLSIPSRRPSVTPAPFERDVMAVMDPLIGARPGALMTLLDRASGGNHEATKRWRALRSSLSAIRDEELAVERDLRVPRRLLVLAGLMALGVGGWLASKHTGDFGAYIEALPFVLGLGFLVPSWILRRLTPQALARHARWVAYVDGLALRDLDGPPTTVPAGAWSRDLALALAVTQVDAHWCTQAPARDGSHWAGSLGDAKLQLLDFADAAEAFGERYQQRFDPPASD